MADLQQFQQRLAEEKKRRGSVAAAGGGGASTDLASFIADAKKDDSDSDLDMDDLAKEMEETPGDL